ncbi:hypothetical protein [Corynebacterium sp.]|uniref:hypothetical protein n=1 Tax=Corynebacterium sp. TaxID=1720 RepID=UPI0026DC191C|nr:hypothetical protein [Corynebacterium sp.]MDO5031383.1 hypothetical protein [Corynebacterium sp.]
MTNLFADQTTTRTRERKGARTMGASRDFTTGPETGQATALLERARRTTPLPSRTPHRGTVPKRRTSEAFRGNRLGSQQVVSIRGRQLHPTPKKNSLFVRMSVIALCLLIAGVVMSMWLSGVSTAQTFKVQELTARDAQLDNQLETLNRDLENVRSAADVARRAHEANMGIPVQPGIVDVAGDGEVKHLREATPEKESVIDVNGDPVRPGQVSSDPRATQDVSGNLNARPGSTQRTDAETRPDSGADSRTEHEDERGNQHQAPQPAQESVELPNIPASAPYEARG